MRPSEGERKKRWWWWGYRHTQIDAMRGPFFVLFFFLLVVFYHRCGSEGLRDGI